MVWTPPKSIERAVIDLTTMKNMGVEVVRTPFLAQDTLYALADSLQLHYFQDLPFSHLTSAALLDSLQAAQTLLGQAVRFAQHFESARTFGLASYSDTSRPESCAFFNSLIEFARSQSTVDLNFYYTTFFIETERCSETVDLVLMDAMDDDSALDNIARWKNTFPETPIGLSALGTWVAESNSERVELVGYLSQHSVDFQARYLEQYLTALFQAPQPSSLDVLFVYRWRDQRLQSPTPSLDPKNPFRHTYGLMTSRDEPRSAFQVVRGFYSNDQQVFAFPVGQPTMETRYWIVLLVWLNLFILSIAYAYFPRFRLTVRRYFTAHGFFREAIREGRELLMGPNTLLFFVFTTAFGICGVVILNNLRATEAFSLLVRWAPDTLQYSVIAFLAQPFLLFVILSGIYGLILSIWTSAIAGISSRSKRSLLPGQSFMLVLWSQWPIIIAMIVAAVLSSSTETPPFRLSFGLAVFIVTIVCLGTLATTRDFIAVCRANAVQIAITLMSNPFLLLLLSLLYVTIKHADKFSFVLHIMMSS